MRRLWWVAAFALTACAGFKPVERGDWKRVYAQDVVERRPDAKQDLITRDAYEVEVAAGASRAYEHPPGFEPTLLQKADALGIPVGGVLEVVVNEKAAVTLELNGDAVELFWNETRKRDGWKDGNDVTVRESSLFLRGKKPGVATLRLVQGPETRDIPVTVTAAPAPARP